MKILMLGPYRRHLVDYLESFGDEVVCYESKLTPESNILEGVDFLVSYGYRYILKDNVLTRFPRRVINLHISLLPYNRGADPNLWSFLEDTPKGVTIHLIDVAVDTGDILAQKEVVIPEDATLRSSYDDLTEAIEELFQNVWPKIRDGTQPSCPQASGGTRHRLKDRVAVEHLLSEGWDTPVKQLIGRALQGCRQ